MNKPLLHFLGHSLQTRWPSVRAMSPEESLSTMERFVAECVRDDLKQRFRERLDVRGVTARMFSRRATTVDLTSPMDASLGLKSVGERPVVARVIWSGWPRFDGFQVEGPWRRFADLMVLEGDATVEVLFGGAAWWLFFPHDARSLWLLTPAKGATRTR